MIAYHLVKINKTFSTKPSHIISSSTPRPSPKDSGGSSPRNFGAAKWLPRGHGETQHRFHPHGGRTSCGKEFFSKNQAGDGGKNGRYNIITGFFEGDRCCFLKQMHELHRLLLMCMCFWVFSCCFCCCPGVSQI